MRRGGSKPFNCVGVYQRLFERGIDLIERPAEIGANKVPVHSPKNEMGFIQLWAAHLSGSYRGSFADLPSLYLLPRSRLDSVTDWPPLFFPE